MPSTEKSTSSWLQAQLLPHQATFKSTLLMGWLRSDMPLEFCMSHQNWSPPSMRTLLPSLEVAALVMVAVVPVSPVQVAPPVVSAGRTESLGSQGPGVGVGVVQAEVKREGSSK